MYKVKNKLRNILDMKNVTQGELAEKVGVNKQQMSCWCRNIFNPSTKYAEKIMAYLQITQEDLFYITNV